MNRTIALVMHRPHFGVRCLGRWFGAAALGLVLGLAGPSALAQVLYRWVMPDGRVVFTDRPANDPVVKSSLWSPGLNAAPGEAPRLPLALRDVVARFPTVLYTTTDCSPCNQGRQLLLARGVPYTEKTVQSSSDQAAFRQRFNADSLPLLTVGNKVFQGYQEQGWHEALTAAGYPTATQLPKGWQSPPPSALTQVQPASAASTPSAARTSATAKTRRSPTPPGRTTPTPARTNPTGIEF